MKLYKIKREVSSDTESDYDIDKKDVSIFSGLRLLFAILGFLFFWYLSSVGKLHLWVKTTMPVLCDINPEMCERDKPL